jgi:hypothetical protein
MGGGCRAGVSVDFSCASSGLGVGQRRWSSSLAAFMFTATELLKGWIDITAANSVCWGSHSVLVAIVSHFLELKTELEVLGSSRSADLIKNETDALWIQVRVASDSLASHVPSSVARNPLDDARE